jgi:hypothetical protein
MPKNSIVGAIGDRLNDILKRYTEIATDNQIYNESGKKVDLTKLIPPKELSRILQAVTSGSVFGESLFEKFFDLSMGRAGRYSEYEQLLYRIPEAAQALQIYVDSILAPNIGDRENNILFNIEKDGRVGSNAKELIQVILKKTSFYDFLPQIIYTTLLYGDCFIEIDKTKSGIRYILHTPKNCTILYDAKTDIELGLIIQQDSESSKLFDMLSQAYPSLTINVPDRVISVISNKVYLANSNNSYEYNSVKTQIEELIKDVFKDYGAKYKYLPPGHYVRFPIYYNNMYYPYGTSIFDPIRSIAKQLLLVEAALSIYRATRTPLRTMWTVEVGSTPEDQISGLINGIMNRVRRQKIIDPDNGTGTSLDSIPEMMTFEEDVWSPSINGAPLIKAEPLQSGDVQPYINDAEYFKKKLLGALGIPPAYLAAEEGASTRALLTLEDIRFSRTIKKYQSDINAGLRDLVDACFIITGHPEYLGCISISLPEPKNVEDNIRIENLNNRLTTANSFMDIFPNIPKLWVLKNVVGLTDDDIDEMTEMVSAQNDLVIFSEQKPGEMAADGSIAMDGGGIPMEEPIGGELGTEYPDMGEDNDMLEGPMGSIDLDELGSEGEESEEEIAAEETEEIETL